MYKGQYDPDPAARRRKRHSRSLRYDPRPKRHHRVPTQLRAWVYGRRHRRTADPAARRQLQQGRRGGYYFQGPRRRRYDPAPRRSYRATARGYGRKAEGLVNRYGTWIGGLLALVAGLWTGINEYGVYGNQALPNYASTIIGGPFKDANGNFIQNRSPEISHLWGSESATGWDPLTYLRYKFTGIDRDGTQVGSAWVAPFWAGLIAWFGASVGKKLMHGKYSRFLTPIAKMGKGATIVSAIGALALPGSPHGNTDTSSTGRVLVMQQNPQHMYMYKG